MSETHDIEPTEKQEVETAQGVERLRERRAFVPRADIYETENALHVVADMPGVDESSIDISLEKNILTLYGRVEEPAFENCTPAYEEYEVGDFERAFTISEGIDREKISASIKDGVLHLTLPKAEEDKPRSITVKAE